MFSSRTSKLFNSAANRPPRAAALLSSLINSAALVVLDTSTSSDTYGDGLYGTATYAATGGKVARQDLIGRGRVVQFMFGNNVQAEEFQIDGLGVMPYLETNA